MILIVADTGPVNYLIQIGQVALLGQVAHRVILPESVAVELRAAAAPKSARHMPKNPTGFVLVSGPEGDDAKHYQEKQIRHALKAIQP